MFEFLFELFGEALLQILFEAFMEFGMHSIAEPFRRPPNPWLAAIGYAIFGVTAGGVSLFVLPDLFVHGEVWRLINLALTPVFAGLAMVALGGWRSRRGQQTFRIDRFSYGYLFALCMALVRFNFAA